MSHAVMYLGAAIYAAEDPFATALLVEDGQIVWMGTDTAARTLLGEHIQSVDVRGALIAPAFVDSHVHLTEMGRALEGLELGHVTGAGQLLAAVALAAAALPQGAPLLGHGWDESTWDDPTLPTPQELERAAQGRDVYLARRDVHTGLVSTALLARAGIVPDAAGEGPDAAAGSGAGAGGLREADHAAVRDLILTADVPSRMRWQRIALRSLAASGHAAVAEMAAPHVSGLKDLTALVSLLDEEEASLPAVYPYWGELVETEEEAAELLRRFGRRLCGLGGDLSVDGSFGSHTAALRQPYADAEGTGELHLSAEQVAAHVVACTRAGTQAAFHAIGDAAVDTVLAGFELAAERVGERELRRAHHRLEHVEGIDAQGIERMLALGLTASVQPRFDELWGGEDGLYATRLGPERALALNPFGSLSAAGVPLALGSDAPVTPVRPWSAVKACMDHHVPSQRLPARAAFLAHSRAGYRAVGEPNPLAGTLRWGAPATFAIWEPSELVVATPEGAAASFSSDARARTPMLPDLESGAPRCLRTVRDGVVLFDAGVL
ncbi:amidohydrolase [Galactobacter caseinivorans]|nr:amidohydrolase family protein [Galactobacter caseinivorans]